MAFVSAPESDIPPLPEGNSSDEDDSDVLDSSFFRYRDATVEVEFDHGEGHRQGDADIKDDYGDPYVAKIYPEVITGKVKTAMEEFGFQLEMNAAPVPVTAGGKYSFSGPREGRSLVHGTIEGYLEWSVDWKMRENDITSSGIEPKYTLTAIIVNPENRVFNMVVRTKATTFANVPVKGRKRIQSTSPRLQVKGRLDREASSPMASELTPPSGPMWSGTKRKT